MRLEKFFVILACVFLAFLFAGKRGWFVPADHQSRARENVFEFDWIPKGSGGVWRLDIKPGRFESFLLVSRLHPEFARIETPMIISSREQGRFESAQFDRVTGIEVASSSSYARLPDDLRTDVRITMSYPLGGCGRIVQANGEVESGSSPTHDALKGFAHAVDFKADMGTPVLAAAAGQVVFAEGRYSDSGKYVPGNEWLDNRVIILHEDGTEAVYGHLKQRSLAVQEGDFVSVGERIASVGNSGFSQNPHLHFHVGGVNLNGYQTISLDFIVKGSRRMARVGDSVC